jgi:NADH-quinone oxidoreductase subunit M
MFGQVTHEVNKTLPDLNLREYAVLLPLVVLAFWIGIYPKPFFNYINNPVEKIVHQVNPDFYKSAVSQSAALPNAPRASESAPAPPAPVVEVK